MALLSWLNRLSDLFRESNPTSRRTPPARTIPRLEALEQREVMSTVSFNPTHGILEIQLSQNDRTVVLFNSGGKVLSTHGLPQLHRMNVPASGVKQIFVTGTELNDRIDLGFVSREGGFYQLQRTEIRGRAGYDFLVGSQVADLILGQKGDDVIDGRGGNDEIRGGADNDTLFGGPGRDVIRGGAGTDHMWGCYHGTSYDGQRDILDGGAGVDYAYMVPGDVLDYVYSAKRR